MSQCKVPMRVLIYAGDVLVAEKEDATLFGRVFEAMLLPEGMMRRCDLCYQVPTHACCINKPRSTPA